MRSLKNLLVEIRGCTHCRVHLPFPPKPILAAHRESKILLIGQAPGLKVHQSAVAWQDASGDRLRQWLGVGNDEFYDPGNFAIVPMGFCYPGKGKSGDLPPRPECAPLWHDRLIELLPKVQLTLLIGRYAHQGYLGNARKKTLTETVESWKEYVREYFPLPHPSPLNNRWISKNPWFEKSVIPALRRRVSKILK